MSKLLSLSLAAPVFLLAAVAAIAQSSAPDADALMGKWRAAVSSGDAAAIRALVADPSHVQVQIAGDHAPTLDSYIAHWVELKKDGLVSVTPTLTKQEQPQPQVTVLDLDVVLKIEQGGKLKTRYEQEALGYVNANGAEQLVFVGRSKTGYIRPLKGLDPNLYDEKADAKAEIAESLEQAKTDHKRTILVFGANWCYDCDVLDAYFHQPEIAPVVKSGFRVIHVDIGRGEKNTDLAKKYDLNLERGVPALAVLDSSGKLLFNDKGGEFESARSMDPEVVLAFLKKWQPGTK